MAATNLYRLTCDVRYQADAWRTEVHSERAFSAADAILQWEGCHLHSKVKRIEPVEEARCTWCGTFPFDPEISVSLPCSKCGKGHYKLGG